MFLCERADTQSFYSIIKVPGFCHTHYLTLGAQESLLY